MRREAMIKCEHFVNGYSASQKRMIFLKSEGLSERLEPEDLVFLLRQGATDGKETVALTPVCKSKAFALSFLKPTVDEYGRRGVWNHTILVPCGQILKGLRVEEVFSPFFIKEGDGVKAPLKPLQVEVNSDGDG